MIFRGWQKTSLIEYPGKIVSILWVSGCNFRCPWCYNKDLVLNPEKLPLIKEEDILDFLEKRKFFLDGVMITGGEPTLNEGLLKFIKKVKNLKYLIGIETNGINPEMIQKLINEKLINFVAMDVKAPMEVEIYTKLAGKKVDLDKIKKSIEIIKNSGIDYEFRTTVVPVLTKDSIMNIAKALRGVKKYVLQQFSPKETVLKEKYKKIRPYSDNELKNMQKAVKKFIKNTNLRI